MERSIRKEKRTVYFIKRKWYQIYKKGWNVHKDQYGFRYFTKIKEF